MNIQDLNNPVLVQQVLSMNGSSLLYFSKQSLIVGDSLVSGNRGGIMVFDIENRNTNQNNQLPHKAEPIQKRMDPQGLFGRSMSKNGKSLEDGLWIGAPGSKDPNHPGSIWYSIHFNIF